MKKYWIITMIILFMGKTFPQSTCFNTGNIGVDMNLYGRIQLFQPDTAGTLNLYSLSILIGTSPFTVFDYWQDSGIQDSTRAFYDSLNGLLGLYGAFNNSYSNLPPDVLVKTYVTALNGNSNVLIKYVIINRGADNINALPGLEIISQLDGIQGFDTVKYIDSLKVIDIYKQNHLGFRLLSGNLKSITSFEYFDGYENDSSYYNWMTRETFSYPSKYSNEVIDGYENDSSYYNWMTRETFDTLYNSGPEGPVTITSQDFQNINPGDSITVYLSMALGSSFAEAISGLDSALVRYNNYLTIVKGNENFPPVSYKLNQNYPNPFNPTTIISLD